MKVIQNRSMVRRLSESIVQNEMSNLALVLQSPSILVTWYSVDPEMSEVIRGYKNVQDYIGSASTLLYDRIENLPMYGIDNLVSTAQYNEEIAGFEEDFQSSGVIFPNTIFPRPNDCFVLDNSFGGFPALYMVTDVRPVTVRSNPFIEISFRLFSREQETIDQLNRQVKGEYVTSLNAIGASHSLVLAKKAQETIEEHINAYLEISYLYTMLFYDKNLAAFVFDGLPGGPGHDRRCRYVDMVLWKFLFDEGVIVYDELANYAAATYSKPTTKIYISTPDIYVDEYAFRRSIYWRLYAKDRTPTIRRQAFDEYRFPHLWEPTPRITKYNGLDIWYIDGYDNTPGSEDLYGDFYLWDDEFLCRIRNNEKYPEVPITNGVCDGCERRCVGSPVSCVNPYLRNALIAHYHGEDIDWGAIQISDVPTIENYYLLPLVLGLYKQHIQSLG